MVSLVFPQITEQRPVTKKKSDDKTNSKDFPYFSFSVFCLTPSTGEEIMVIFSFPVDAIPKLEKEDQENYLLLSRVVTNFCNLKGSLYSTHILCAFFHFQLFIF